MMWCPKCKSEYREGYKVCRDCGSELVEKLEYDCTKAAPYKETNIMKTRIYLKISSLFAGILIIFLAPLLSYKLTESHFIPDSSKVYAYNPEHFKWMLTAYLCSIILVGVIMCTASIVSMFKSHR